MRGTTEPFRRGDLWLVQLNPVVGHEQTGTRPALIASSDHYHRLQAGFVTLVPVTTRHRPWPSYETVSGAATGLNRPSFVLADQVRTMSAERLRRWLGSVDERTMTDVEQYLTLLLDL